MPSNSNTREPPRIEPGVDLANADVANPDVANKSTLSAGDSLRLHLPEYAMEAGETGVYLFSACAFATLLWHPASPIQRYPPSDAVRRMLMGLAMVRLSLRSPYHAATFVLTHYEREPLVMEGDDLPLRRRRNRRGAEARGTGGGQRECQNQRWCFHGAAPLKSQLGTKAGENVTCSRTITCRL
jgi:hypothetical protein